MDEAEVRSVLTVCDVGPVRHVGPLDVFPVRPWRVEAEAGNFVLREARLSASPESLRLEHELAEWLVAAGLPVAMARPCADGAACVQRDGRLFALYDYLPGEPFTPRDRGQARSAGGTLARFHQCADRFPRTGELTAPAAYRTAAADAAELDEHWCDSGDIGWLTGGHRQLDGGLAVAELVEGVNANDFSTGNVAFVDGAVSGLFDLECCFRGARLLDLANSVLWFSVVEGGVAGVGEHEDEVDVDCARAFLRGYHEASVLTPLERGMLPDALRRGIRRWAMFDLVDILAGGTWSEREWRHSKAQTDLIDRSAEAMAAFEE